MQADNFSWYCARTKPKHEHIAAANVSKNLGLEVFNPRLRMKKATRRGLVCLEEPLFPCYIFVRCELTAWQTELRYTAGVSSLIHFGDRVPAVPDSIIDDLRKCFSTPQPMVVEDQVIPGSEVILAEGAFIGMRAVVLRVLPARQRVQVLLDILGRSTAVEVDRYAVAMERNGVADRVPILAVPLSVAG